jgi:ATP/maltotriose-dependent transcriptional regulator MalT
VLDRSQNPGLPSTLVGRADELAVLDRHARAARAGRAGFVLVSGPAGIGKTSLLRGLCGSDSCRGMTVLYATCCEVVAGTGYGAVRQLFAPLRLADDLGSPLLEGSARRALPALGDEPATAAGPSAYPVLHGLYWLAVNLMGQGPLVLVLDDIHWCDERSLRWLEFLVRRADDLPLLVVLSQRTEQAAVAPAAVADLAAQPRATALPLQPLTEAAVAELVRRAYVPAADTAGTGTAGTGTAGSGTAGSGTAGSGTAGSGTAGSGTAGSGTAGSGTAGTGTAGSGTAGTDAAGTGTAGPDAAEAAAPNPETPADPVVARPFVVRAAAVSGGNPLTLSRLLRELKADGVRPDAQSAHRVDEVGGHVVAGSVHGWLDRQPERIAAVATAIAVVGPEPPELLAALAEVSATVLEQAVGVLRQAELVAAGHVDLVHDLVRAAVLERLDAATLGRWRARAALLLSDAGRPADEVANQLLLLPVLEAPWMVAVLRDAATLAAGRGAPEAAARYLYRVLEAKPGSVEIRLQLAKALAEFHPAEALRLLDEALELPADVRTRTMIAVQYGFTSLSVQRSPTAVRVLTTVLDQSAVELGPDPDPADRELRTLAEATLMIVGADEKVTVAAVRERVAATPMPPGDTPAQRQMLAMGSVLASMDGDNRERVVDQARRALRPPDNELANWVLLPASLVFHLADEVREALDLLDRVLADAQRNAAVWTYALALSTKAQVLHSLGEISEAVADAQTAFEIIGNERWGAGMSTPQIALAHVLVERGQPERAEWMINQITRPNMDRFVWEYHRYLSTVARVRWALGDREDALRRYLDCGRSLRECGLVNPVFTRWWVDAACVAAELGRTDEVREVVEQAAELAARWGTSRVLGWAALARGMTSRGSDAVAHLTDAVRWLADAPAQLDHAQAEYLLGAALLGVDHRAAREHLRNAVDTAQRCGALALARAARADLVAAGGRMRDIAVAPADMLTGMERKVAGLVVAGESNRAIAESLFVTVRTVEMHLTSVYRKLGIAQRSELGAVLADPIFDDRTVGDSRPPEWVLESRGRR